MTANQVYVAFQASPELQENTLAFVQAVQARPGENHQALLEKIPHPFIDEVLAAFFEGPMLATRIQGGAANMIHSLMHMVGKASRALVGKVFSKVHPDEQIELARLFSSMMIECDGTPYCGFLIDAELANEAGLMFQNFRHGDGDTDHLVRVMEGISSGAVESFFDRPMGCVKVGMVTRGLVSAARVTIHKAAHSVNARVLPELDPGPRQRVLDYFDAMLMERQG